MSELFEHTSYKSYLIDLIKEKSSVRGYHGQLARAAGCQASYLTQVLKSKVELTPDHAVGIGKHLGLSDLELDFFLNLVLVSRAATPALKDMINSKLRQLQRDQQILNKRLTRVEVESQNHAFYYSSWIYLSIHMAIGIPELRTVEALGRKFLLDLSAVRRVLKSLQRAGLATVSQDQWTPLKRESHLAPESFMTEANHVSWQARAITDLQRDPGEWIHYASAFTITRNDSSKLRLMILDFIEQTRAKIHESGEEEVFSMLIDFFPV